MLRWKSISVPLLLVAATLLAVEITLRATLFRCAQPEPNLCASGSVSYHYNHKPGGGDLEPDQDGVWALWPHRPYHVQINSDGLRNTEEVDPDVAIRILAVGDSFTFGPYVTNEDTWPAWLESLLRRRGIIAGSVQVLNAGVAGYTIQDEYYYLVERGLSLHPQLVILAFFPNDISDFQDVQREYLSRPPRLVEEPSPRFLAREFYLRLEDDLAMFQLVGRLRNISTVDRVGQQLETEASSSPEGSNCDEFSRPARIELDPCWSKFKEWLQRTISLLQDHKVPLLLVSIPDHQQLPGDEGATAPQDFVAEIAASMNTPYVDVLPVLRENSDVETAYLLRYDSRLDALTGNGHMSAIGYRSVAETIAAYLENNGLLQR